MFEAVELGRKVKKRDYAERVPTLRTELLTLQRELVEAGFSVLVVLGGVDGAGKSELANLLHEWMDARFLTAHAFGPPNDEEHDRPDHWRYWMSLPPAGRTGIYVGSWYTGPIVKRALGKIDDAQLDEAMQRVVTFEQMLADDGTLVLKFWLHLSEEQQTKRIAKLGKDPRTAWRVTKHERKLLRHHADMRRSAERALRLTSTGPAPWVLVEAGHARYRNLTVAQTVLDRLRVHLEEHARQRQAAAANPPAPEPEPDATLPTVLDRVDLSSRVDRDTYDSELSRLQSRFGRLARHAQQVGQCCTLVFEGWDAAGKGGCIRRLIHPLDARFFRVIPISAPTEEERAHHYLWRFWRHIPRAGHMTIYDRSWYGRVLVERVEGYATHDQWQRAFKEINDFEEQLRDHGTVLLKFWLQVSQEEQLRRFEERRRIPWKQHKLTDEDWRNREKAPLYMRAVNDMVARTSTEFAPWSLVPAEDKHVARLHVLQTACDALDQALQSR